MIISWMCLASSEAATKQLDMEDKGQKRYQRKPETMQGMPKAQDLANCIDSAQEIRLGSVTGEKSLELFI